MVTIVSGGTRAIGVLLPSLEVLGYMNSRLLLASGRSLRCGERSIQEHYRERSRPYRLWRSHGVNVLVKMSWGWA